MQWPTALFVLEFEQCRYSAAAVGAGGSPQLALITAPAGRAPPSARARVGGARPPCRLRKDIRLARVCRCARPRAAMKRKEAPVTDLAAAVEAAKAKAASRTAGIWQESLAGPAARLENNYGTAEDALEVMVSRGASTALGRRRPPATVQRTC